MLDDVINTPPTWTPNFALSSLQFGQLWEMLGVQLACQQPTALLCGMSSKPTPKGSNGFNDNIVECKPRVVMAEENVESVESDQAATQEIHRSAIGALVDLPVVTLLNTYKSAKPENTQTWSSLMPFGCPSSSTMAHREEGIVNAKQLDLPAMLAPACRLRFIMLDAVGPS